MTTTKRKTKEEIANSRESEISWVKLITFLVVLISSIVLAWLSQPIVTESEQAINFIITVFSILTGFLIALLLFIGDASILRSGSWRAGYFHMIVIEGRLARHYLLFSTYLATLGLIFMSLMLKQAFPNITEHIEKFYLSLGFIAFFYSFFLPHSLRKAQQERLDNEIKKRRKKAGIED